MALYLFILFFKTKLKWGSRRKNPLQTELTLCSQPPRQPAQWVPPSPLPPVGWISSSFPGGLLLKQRLLYAVHLFTDEVVFLHYLGTWIQVHTSSKTNKWKRNPQCSFCSVSVDKTPFRDILFILLLWTKPAEWGSEQADHIPMSF